MVEVQEVVGIRRLEIMYLLLRHMKKIRALIKKYQTSLVEQTTFLMLQPSVHLR